MCQSILDTVVCHLAMLKDVEEMSMVSDISTRNESNVEI